MQISKDIYFEFIWPNLNNQINKNILNNNSIVCKLKYNNFSCLFTGDIEIEAEKEIINKYKNNEMILKTDILKIAHHGSKTSSSEKFINLCNPKICTIGVGKNNNFGHPNEIVLKRLQDIGAKIYRTDICGEIIINVNHKGKISVKNLINGK